MAEEGTYEAECMRSELLGIDPPDRATFEAARTERMRVAAEELEIAHDVDLAERGEQMHGASGKLDELNSILSATQRKLTKFKTVCGSLTNLIKIRGSTSNLHEEEAAAADGTQNDINTAIEAMNTMQVAEGETNITAMKNTVQDLGHKVSSNIDALDSLIAKSERAEASMNEQNQQMKKILRK